MKSDRAPMRMHGADAYIRSLAMEPGAWITSETAESAIGLLRFLRGRVSSLGLPVIGPAIDASIGFTWRNSRYYVNVRIDSAGEVEFYFEDIQSGQLWSDEGRHASEGMLARLRLAS